MGFLDRFKKQAEVVKDKAAQVGGDLKDKASDLAESGKLGDGIDKAADLANKATKGKFEDKIDNVAEKAKEQTDKLADDGKA